MIVERLAPVGAAVRPGELRLAALHAEHGHLYGMVESLAAVGAEVAWVHDRDPARQAELAKRWPQARVARSEDEVLADPAVALVLTADVPDRRADLACRALAAGKDAFLAKPACASLADLARMRDACARTGRRIWVCYGERLQSEAGEYALHLVRRGAIGRVVQVLGLGPHRLNRASRPAWFFDGARSGGVLGDLASHQAEQFIAYGGGIGARVARSAIANRRHPDLPGFDDFGEASFVGERGESGYCRVDWLTPDGLGTWGDVRTMILGTEGYLDLRKTIDLGRPLVTDVLHLVDHAGEQRVELAGQVGLPFFPRLARDCVDRTDTAMGQAHVFAATELALRAQAQAERL